MLLLLVVEDMTLLCCSHAYTVVLTFGHPGTVKSSGVQTSCHGWTLFEQERILSGLLVCRRDHLGAVKPAHSLAWEPCPEPGNGAASPLFSIDS